RNSLNQHSRARISARTQSPAPRDPSWSVEMTGIGDRRAGAAPNMLTPLPIAICYLLTAWGPLHLRDGGIHLRRSASFLRFTRQLSRRSIALTQTAAAR